MPLPSEATRRLGNGAYLAAGVHLRNRENVLHQATEYLCDGPGLRGASFADRTCSEVAVEDLGELSFALIVQVSLKWREHLTSFRAGCIGLTANFHVSGDEGAEQPRPRSALVI